MQNIVSCIGFFCKRDLWLKGSYNCIQPIRRIILFEQPNMRKSSSHRISNRSRNTQLLPKHMPTRQCTSLLANFWSFTRIHSGVDDPHLRQFVQHLHKARLHCDQFEKAGFLSAMPCWRPPTNEDIDKQNMAGLFESTLRGQVSDATHCREKDCDVCTTTIPSHVMQQALRMYGLFDFTSPSSDPVIDRISGAKPPL